MAAAVGPPGPPPPAQPAPSPLGTASALRLAWGLTLNLSGDKNQNSVGASFLKDFVDLKAKFPDGSAADYLNELSAAVAGYLRTNGFEREAIVGYLDAYKKSRDARVDSIKELANLGSVSPGSFLVRLAGFLGIGSLASLSNVLGSLAKPTPGLPFNLDAFLVFGFLGVLLITLVFRAIEGTLVELAMRDCQQKQLEFWKQRGRKRYKDELKNLGTELFGLESKFSYSHEVSLGGLDGLVDSILPAVDLYEMLPGNPPWWRRSSRPVAGRPPPDQAGAAPTGGH